MIYKPGDTLTLSDADFSRTFPGLNPADTSIRIKDVAAQYESYYHLNAVTSAYDYDERAGRFTQGALTENKRPAQWGVEALGAPPPGGDIRLTIPAVLGQLRLRNRYFILRGDRGAVVDVDTLGESEKHFCCAMSGLGTALYSATSDGHNTRINLHRGTLSDRDVRAEVENLFEPALHVDARNVLWLTGVALRDTENFDLVQHRLLRSGDGGRTWQEQVHPHPRHNPALGGIPDDPKYLLMLRGYMSGSIRRDPRPFVWSVPSGTLYLFTYSSEELPPGIGRDYDVRMGLFRSRENGKDGSWKPVPPGEITWGHQDMRSIRGRGGLVDPLERRLEMGRDYLGASRGLRTTTNALKAPLQSPSTDPDLSPLVLVWPPYTSPNPLRPPILVSTLDTPVAGDAQLWLDEARGRLHLWGSTKSYGNTWPDAMDGLQRWFTSDDWGRTWQDHS